MSSRTTPSVRTCDQALARAFTVLGKRWNGVLIGTLIDGPAGFTQLARSIEGISESVLSDRLSELAFATAINQSCPGHPGQRWRREIFDHASACEYSVALAIVGAERDAL